MGVSAGLAEGLAAFDLFVGLATFVMLTLYKSKGCECGWHLTMWPMESPDYLPIHLVLGMAHRIAKLVLNHYRGWRIVS